MSSGRDDSARQTGTEPARKADAASSPTTAEARRRLAPLGLADALGVRDLHDLQPSRDFAERVVACEVLEHVPDPERARARLAELARPHLIVSVPREPLCVGRESTLTDNARSLVIPGSASSASTMRLLPRRSRANVNRPEPSSALISRPKFPVGWSSRSETLP